MRSRPGKASLGRSDRPHNCSPRLSSCPGARRPLALAGARGRCRGLRLRVPGCAAGSRGDDRRHARRIHGSLLAWFASSLRPGREALVTSLARQVRGSLEPDVAAYTRNVTRAWCVFFAAQPRSALLLAFAPTAIWSWFVNILDLPLVGLMFLGEYAFRVRRFRHGKPATLAQTIKAFRLRAAGRHEERQPPAKPRGAAAESPWSPSRLVRAATVLHVLAAAALIVRPDLWAWVLGAIAATHGAMAALGMLPRNRLLGPNLNRLPGTSAERRDIALTFDDGPDPLVTPRVLDILDAHGAKASFFCIGERVEAEPALTREILRRGHSVENHSHSHPLGFALSLAGASPASSEPRARQSRKRRAPLRSSSALRWASQSLLDYAVHRAGLQYVSWTRRGFDGVDGNADAVLGRLDARIGGRRHPVAA